MTDRDDEKKLDEARRRFPKTMETLDRWTGRDAPTPDADLIEDVFGGDEFYCEDCECEDCKCSCHEQASLTKTMEKRIGQQDKLLRSRWREIERLARQIAALQAEMEPLSKLVNSQQTRLIKSGAANERLREVMSMAVDYFDGCQVDGKDDPVECATVVAENLRRALDGEGADR